VHLYNGQLAVEQEITCALTADVFIPGKKDELSGSDGVIKKFPRIAEKWSNGRCALLSLGWKQEHPILLCRGAQAH
jgi:hypothetical protein